MRSGCGSFDFVDNFKLKQSFGEELCVRVAGVFSCVKYLPHNGREPLSVSWGELVGSKIER